MYSISELLLLQISRHRGSKRSRGRQVMLTRVLVVLALLAIVYLLVTKCSIMMEVPGPQKTDVGQLPLVERFCSWL